MKNFKWRYVFVLICCISITINVVFVHSYFEAKRTLFDSLYTNMVNITTATDGLISSVTVDENAVDYSLVELNRECIQLDDSIYGLTVVSQSNLNIKYRFSKGYELIEKLIREKSNSRSFVVYNLTQYKEKLLSLIAQLSPNGKLNDDKYKTLRIIPNYSLSTHEIINIIDANFTD